MSDEANHHPSRPINLGSERLRVFFVNHLNRIFHAKSHLVQRLPTLRDEAHFLDLRESLAQTINDVEKQIARMEMIYALLDASVSKRSVRGLTSLIDDAFEAIQEQRDEPALRDLSILFYLQNIESVEMASFQILQMAAVKLKNKQITQLLKENYDEAKADRTLLLLVSSKYITN